MTIFHLRIPAQLFGILFSVLVLQSCNKIPSKDSAEPLQSFTVRDYLGHQWDNEIVHFDFDVPASGDLTLTDRNGLPVAVQFSDIRKTDGRTKGRLWTVASVAPDGETNFQLREGKSRAPTRLRVAKDGDGIVLSNERIAVRLPQWPGVLKKPGDLTALQAPLLGVRGKEGGWLGGGQWFGEGLIVREATTTIVEKGPVKGIVELNIVFIDGRTYSATIELEAGQEVARIREESNVSDLKAGWRFSMEPGLKADHVFWNNQWKATENAKSWRVTDTAANFEKPNVIANLRAWTFWWEGDLTMWAGFYQKAAAKDSPFVGVLMMKPSEWMPCGYDGFERTQIPITAGPERRLDLTLAFAAARKKASGAEVAMMATPRGDEKTAVDSAEEVLVPVRRAWGVTVGTVADHYIDPQVAWDKVGTVAGTPKLRRLLIKHSEFPLDRVKDFGFDFQTLNAGKSHPYLIMTAGDLERVRRQAKTVPSVKGQVEIAKNYIAGCGGVDKTLANEGPAAFYLKHYVGNDLSEKLPVAYLGSDDPLYGKLLAAAVTGLSRQISARFLDSPMHPSLAGHGHTVAESFIRLLLNYDLIADSGLLTPEERRKIYSTLVFSAHLLAHEDYWRPEHGMASGNPNMTSMLRLPLGLFGLYLAGHPEASKWLEGAEAELKYEISPDYISPSANGLAGGAWIESPHYQTASLDGMMLLATAIRNVHGRDYFSDPVFKSSMRYFGFLLTPPERRFPPVPNPGKVSFLVNDLLPGQVAPATVTTVGDMQAGRTYPFTGWMAAATATSDPEFSKQQQFFWKVQNFPIHEGGRARGFILALTNPELASAPPGTASEGFSGFGSMLRTSWTDPRASFVVHRTGLNSHHFHSDNNSLTYFAKGAPLCLDFGNLYQPLRRDEPWYHNLVSFEVGARKWGMNGNLVGLQTLPSAIDYSYGVSGGGGGQKDHRHVLMVKSADPLGANYVVVRDKTEDGQPGQKFFWNMWCLSKEAEIAGNVVHFPGQFDVDLDIHFLAPSELKIEKDHWKWSTFIGTWGNFNEEMHGVRVPKSGSKEDYLAVLYPRAQGQAAADVSALSGGAALQIKHMEGRDLILCSPGQPARLEIDDVLLTGEMAMVRKSLNGALRLTVLGSDAVARSGAWSLQSNGAATIEVKDLKVEGETTGGAQNLVIEIPEGFDPVVNLDGQVLDIQPEGRKLTVKIAAGTRYFTLTKR